MSSFKLDLKTVITWLIIAFGAGGGWYTLKLKVDAIQVTVTEIKEKQASMAEKLSGAIGSDGIHDSNIKHNEKATTKNAADLQRHIERHNP